MSSDLTIVVPTIGRATLWRAVASVLCQTVPVEFSVVSDRDKHGCAATLNRAVLTVMTPYVAGVGDDDRLDAHFHQWFIEENDDADLFVFTMRYPEDWNDGRELPEERDPSMWEGGDVGGSYVVRTELARRFPFATAAEDWNMIRTVRDFGFKVQVSERVAYYVRH